MALPTSMKLWSGGLFPTGIEIGLFPSTQRRLSMELQASTVGSTASSVWTSVAIPAPRPGLAGLTYRYNIPMSTRRYYFRARHGAQEGMSDGAFTAKISAKPVILIDYMPPHPMVNAIGNVEVPGANILISSGNTPKVGSQNTTAYKAKEILIPFTALIPAKNGGTWAFTSAYAHANSTAASTMYAPVVVPINADITGIAFRVYKNGAPDTITSQLFKVNTTGSVTSLATHTYSAGSGFLTYSTSITPEPVTTTKHFLLRVTFASGSSATFRRFYWYKLAYRIADYARAY